MSLTHDPCAYDIAGGMAWRDGDEDRLPSVVKNKFVEQMDQFACVLSLLGCAWLVWRLRNLPALLRRRPFLRQVLALAYADLIFHTGFLALNLVPVIFHGAESSDFPCKVSGVVRRFGRLISAFLETHIAFSFSLQAFRRYDYVNTLHRCLPLVLPMAVLATCGAGANEQYDARCKCCHHAHAENVDAGVLLGCFLSSMAAYGAMIYRASMVVNLPGSVVGQNFRRALVYPLNFFVTYGPLLLYMYDLTPVSWKSGPWFRLVHTLEQSNGLANALTYFLQSKYARISTSPGNEIKVGDRVKLTVGAPPDLRHGALHVDGSTGVITRVRDGLCTVGNSLYPTVELEVVKLHSGRLPRRASCRVEFAGVSVVDVAPILHEAFETAEMEMQQIESLNNPPAARNIGDIASTWSPMSWGRAF